MAYLLHHLLTESAVHVPDKDAVRFQDERLTYAELDRLTNKVANALQSVGVRRGDRVGIYIHKSMASVISVFGILKAGAVYVPLDPGAPASRLAYILRNCGVQVLLTSVGKQTDLAQIVMEETPLTTIILTDGSKSETVVLPDSLCVVPWHTVLSEGDSLTPIPTIETDLAYILYTSGSTGEPKGVMIAHRTVFTFINWCHKEFGINEEDRVTSHAPLHFDLSTFDLYVTIKAGGAIVLVPEKLSIFPVQLVKLLQDEGITVTYLVPSILSMMVNYGQLDRYDLKALRMVLFAGEVFPIKYLRQLVTELPHPDYYNLYGPTETNVCTYYKVQTTDLTPNRTEPVPIGVACENIEVFAVNERNEPMTKPGTEGELWVRGSCVAQGYWGDVEKTATRFVKNPFQPHFDEIVYRTGDIVTLDEDGSNWRYVGRRDDMVKSRGYRIELGEVETVLYSHESVKEVAVVAIPDDLLGNRIKAFVVSHNQHRCTVQELEAYCSRQLPRYMLPETVTFLSELPKTSTGKIDRPSLVQSLIADSGHLEQSSITLGASNKPH